jgi:hypothetical protein
MSVKAFEREKRQPNGNAKLSFDDVRNIRSSDLNDNDLANQYGVKVQQIRRIRQRTAWKYVD